jgi:hypothetical protein
MPPPAAPPPHRTPSPNADPRLEVIAAGPPTANTGTLQSYAKNGSFFFIPKTGWTGTTVFPYTITDVDTGLNASANVYITIVPPITAVDDSYTGTYNQDYTPPEGNLTLVNDVSISPAPQLEVISAGPLISGSGSLVAWYPNGSFVFRPTTGWSGELRGGRGRPRRLPDCRSPGGVQASPGPIAPWPAPSPAPAHTRPSQTRHRLGSVPLLDRRPFPAQRRQRERPGHGRDLAAAAGQE